MPVYNDLKLDTKYLINEFDGDEVLLVEPIMKTELCILILIHEDVETFAWKKLNNDIFLIIEEFNEEKSDEYDALFEDDYEIEP
jgi:hypothetical protein